MCANLPRFASKRLCASLVTRKRLLEMMFLIIGSATGNNTLSSCKTNHSPFLILPFRCNGFVLDQALARNSNEPPQGATRSLGFVGAAGGGNYAGSAYGESVTGSSTGGFGGKILIFLCARWYSLKHVCLYRLYFKLGVCCVAWLSFGELFNTTCFSKTRKAKPIQATSVTFVTVESFVIL